MKSLNHYILILLVIFLIVSCKKKSSCFHGYGEETSFFIETGSFNEINVSGDFKVNLIESDEFKVEVFGGENNSKFIDVKNENEILFIENRNKCNWLRDYNNKIQINIYFINLRVLRNLDESYIFSNDFLSVDTLFIHITGVGNVNLKMDSVKYLWSDLYVLGDLELSGTAINFHSKIASFGNLKAENLWADSMYIETSDEGDAHIYPLSFTKATCNKIGNIYYYNEGEDIVVIENNIGKYLKAE